LATQNFRVKNGLEVGTGVTISAGIITATTVSIGGSVTAGSFYGDGSELTNAGSSLSAASGSQRVVLTSLTSGTMTSASTNSDLLYDSVTNTLTCKNISIGGTLTYEDVTNVDSIGVITARNGIVINSGGIQVTSGVSTFAGITTITGPTLFTNQLSVSGVGTITTLNETTLRNYGETVNNVGNTGTAATINLFNGNFVTATLTGNCTFTFTTGLTSGAISFTLLLTNDGTAGRSIIWPPAVKWPNGTVPTRTTAANKTDVYTFFTYDNGTTWWGNLSLYNYS